jgi:hypothetical protein
MDPMPINLADLVQIGRKAMLQSTAGKAPVVPQSKPEPVEHHQMNNQTGRGSLSLAERRAIHMMCAQACNLASSLNELCDRNWKDPAELRHLILKTIETYMLELSQTPITAPPQTPRARAGSA